MKVKRGDRVYEVIEQFGNEVCVEEEFDFAKPPYKRMIKMWWNLEYCEVLEDRDG